MDMMIACGWDINIADKRPYNTRFFFCFCSVSIQLRSLSLRLTFTLFSWQSALSCIWPLPMPRFATTSAPTRPQSHATCTVTFYHYQYAACLPSALPVSAIGCYDDIAPDNDGLAADCMEPGYRPNDFGYMEAYARTHSVKCVIPDG